MMMQVTFLASEYSTFKTTGQLHQTTLSSAFNSFAMFTIHFQNEVYASSSQVVLFVLPASNSLTVLLNGQFKTKGGHNVNITRVASLGLYLRKMVDGSKFVYFCTGKSSFLQFENNFFPVRINLK